MYYLTFDGGGNAIWSLANASSVSTSSNMIGIAVSTGQSNEVGVLIKGFGRFTSEFDFSAGNNGQPLYIGTINGEIITTPPSGAGEIVRIVGYLINKTQEVIYLCPDSTYIEI